MIIVSHVKGASYKETLDLARMLQSRFNKNIMVRTDSSKLLCTHHTVCRCIWDNSTTDIIIVNHLAYTVCHLPNKTIFMNNFHIVVAGTSFPDPSIPKFVDELFKLTNYNDDDYD